MGVSYRRLRMVVLGLLKLAAPAMVAFSFMAATTGGASAVTSGVNCGSPTVFNLTANVGITCGGFGEGNSINGTGGSEPASPTLDGVPGTAFPANGILSLTNLGTTTGGWTLTKTPGFLFTSLVIAFQGATPHGGTSPDWAWFRLADSALTTLTGTWTITTKNLASAYVYGTMVAAVPVPAGIALGASALGLLGLVGLRRKKNVSAAA